MVQQLVVSDQIEIEASKETVWDVLTNPDFIRQWDDIPENYSGGHLEPGTVIDWEGYSRLTVTTYDKPSVLKLSMHLPRVKLEPSQYDVSYMYILTGDSGITLLRFQVGDFSPLPEAKDYYDASLDWVQTVKQKIKELAEHTIKIDKDQHKNL